MLEILHWWLVLALVHKFGDWLLIDMDASMLIFNNTLIKFYLYLVLVNRLLGKWMRFVLSLSFNLGESEELWLGLKVSFIVELVFSIWGVK